MVEVGQSVTGGRPIPGMRSDIVAAKTLPDSGHFVPEEAPDELIQHILDLSSKVQGASA